MTKTATPDTIKQAGLEQFTTWFVKNYPGPDTVIFDPKWHAPKIYRAALAAMPRPEQVAGTPTINEADRIAAAIEACDWSGSPIGNKEILKAAVAQLRSSRKTLPPSTDRDAEIERLRFEGDLDKWMKIIGAGISGYQPEAYALMDAACRELVDNRAKLAKAVEALKTINEQTTPYALSEGVSGFVYQVSRAALAEKAGDA